MAKSSGQAAALQPVPLVDYFVHQDGVSFAGRHLLVDMWQASRLDDIEHIEASLTRAAEASGATVLNTDFHQFSDTGGVSGVVILAESHISIHTWPERDFAAIDIFMCGSCDPYKALPLLKEAFAADSLTLNESKRGLTS